MCQTAKEQIREPLKQYLISSTECSKSLTHSPRALDAVKLGAAGRPSSQSAMHSTTTGVKANFGHDCRQ